MKRVDLNVDIGEGFPFDEALLDYATSANVCCGEHAGSWDLTQETIALALRKGARIGLHPGFPDRESMGRARMQLDETAQYANSLFEQVIRFQEYVGRTLGESASYVKPHGAWYNMLCEDPPKDPALFRACQLTLEGVLAFTKLPAMLLADSSIALATEGESVISEGFADRGYAGSGGLLPRSEPGAVLNNPDQIRAQAIRLAERVDSICIHGDTPGCVEIAALVYSALEEGGFEVGF